jgi:integrase
MPDDTELELYRPRAGLPALTVPDASDVQAARRQAIAPATLRAYKRALDEFEAFCRAAGVPFVPPVDPELVARYVYALATTPRYTTKQRAALAQGNKPGEPAGDLPSRSLLDQQLAAITWWHKLADLPSPAATARVRLVLKGTMRQRGPTPPPKKKRAALPAIVSQLLDAARTQDNPGHVARDPALLLLLFSHGFRRSEVASLEYPGGLNMHSDPPVVILGQTKTEAAGRTLPLLHDGVLDALRVWLAHRTPLHGPLFLPVDRSGACIWSKYDGGDVKPLTDHAVANIVKKLAKLAGLDPKEFAGHSLRRGFATNGYRQGVDEVLIQKSLGHKKADTTRGYREEGLLGDTEEWAAHQSALEGIE